MRKSAEICNRSKIEQIRKALKGFERKQEEVGTYKGNSIEPDGGVITGEAKDSRAGCKSIPPIKDTVDFADGELYCFSAISSRFTRSPEMISKLKWATAWKFWIRIGKTRKNGKKRKRNMGN